jgi:hypothetical protein
MGLVIWLGKNLEKGEGETEYVSDVHSAGDLPSRGRDWMSVSKTWENVFTTTEVPHISRQDSKNRMK